MTFILTVSSYHSTPPVILIWNDVINVTPSILLCFYCFPAKFSDLFQYITHNNVSHTWTRNTIDSNNNNGHTTQAKSQSIEQQNVKINFSWSIPRGIQIAKIYFLSIIMIIIIISCVCRVRKMYECQIIRSGAQTHTHNVSHLFNWINYIY